MSISYPLSLPTATGLAQITFRMRDVIGVAESPFDLSSQVYDMGGARWEADIVLPPMVKASADDWLGWIASLRGMFGTFLLIDPDHTSPRGTWAGTPLSNGSHAAGVRSIAMDGFTAGATVKRGDRFSVGSGSTTRYYMVAADATASGGGTLTLEIWPALRATLADNTALTTSSPACRMRLASNVREWTAAPGVLSLYGLRFSCIEALE